MHGQFKDRALIGVDNLMWGSDYPHAESTWPRSRQVLEAILEGVPEAERQKIAGANAARVYHLD
jgi:predicted TIM-barrel fold metal-dependent hydrolase